ncbi:hypothetical protein [Paraburkholderia sediminicola]|uniref:hypothetical protein n=1 Tax=Paraburkholderia sediminicola TaxID=458836 RepID=UPI0038BD31F2
MIHREGMTRAYKLLGVGFVLAIAGHFLQLAGLHMSARTRDHATEQGHARLESRVGRTYWVRPNVNSTYQFVRFGNENTADSITHGIAVKDTEHFTVILLSARPNSDSGTYQVRFADGTLKWMDDSAFKIHLYAPTVKVKVASEIFEQDPRVIVASLQGAHDANGSPYLGPEFRDAAKPSDVSFGMTEQQVLASDWGRPNNVTTEQTPTGTVDLWMYSRGNFLAFRNSRLEEVLNDM